MKKLLLLIVLLLTACTTPAERRMQRPDLDITSTKSARDVAICIADKWENTTQFMSFSSLPVNTSMKPDGYSITVAASSNLFGGTNNTILVADIRELRPPGSSSTKYYKQKSGGFGAYDEVVKQCQ